ncbi:RyR domain-containing protein (plasmid) [Mycolicibacterium aichiense]|uniref:RyR domain-containing protein n=1 Tax=Mycolicibacterium aichiense TaxID=1799 RepID=UPI003D66FB35
MTNESTAGQSVMRALRGLARMVRYPLGVTGVAAAVYLCAIAVQPDIRDAAPGWAQWFGEPGSSMTIAIVLLVPVLGILLSRFAGGKAFSLTPLLVLAVMAASAIAFGLSAFWNCHANQSVFFAPLNWTLYLFVGNTEGRYDNHFCPTDQIPVALEIARILAIATTLTTAIAAARTLFRSHFDRIAIWRARSVTVVVGADEDTISLLRAIASRIGRREMLVVVTSAANRRCINEARAVGARVREVAALDGDTLKNLRLWKHLSRLYLLSEDPVKNESRLRAIDAAMDRHDVNRPRLPLTARIDDPWQAEVWRRSFLDSETAHGAGSRSRRRWVADAVGRYETTAATVLRHMVSSEHGCSPPKTVLICGLFPLTYALMSELAQMHREQAVYPNPKRSLPAHARVMATDASGFLTDHQLRQERIAPGEPPMSITAQDVDPTVDAISAFVTDTPDCCVVLTDPSMETQGTRLAARHPQLTIYVASSSAQTLPESSIVGRIFPFPITMDFSPEAPQDAWERAAELIHESYRVNAHAQGWPIAAEVNKDWHLLDPFWKQSNRRLVTHTLALAESVGYTWNTLDQPPADPLPENFAEMERREKLHHLGFSDQADIDRMIASEHDDWCRFYTSEGWRYAAQRDNQKRRHDLLLPWPELLENDASRHQARGEESLIEALHTLRSLGFRCIPKTDISA